MIGTPRPSSSSVETTGSDLLLYIFGVLPHEPTEIPTGARPELADQPGERLLRWEDWPAGRRGGGVRMASSPSSRPPVRPSGDPRGRLGGACGGGCRSVYSGMGEVLLAAPYTRLKPGPGWGTQAKIRSTTSSQPWYDDAASSTALPRGVYLAARRQTDAPSGDIRVNCHERRIGSAPLVRASDDMAILGRDRGSACRHVASRAAHRPYAWFVGLAFDGP